MKSDRFKFLTIMKSLFFPRGIRMALIGTVLGWLAAALNPAAGQTFTTPGGIGFSVAPGSYTGLLGSTENFSVTIQPVNDGANDFDGNDADQTYGQIGSVYDKLFEYEDLLTGQTYWTTNVDNGNFEYTYANGDTYWDNNDQGDYQYNDPATGNTWWTSTYVNDYEYQLWNGTTWVDEWSDVSLGDGIYEYAEWNGSQYVYSWSDADYGLYEYIDPWTGATSWTDSDSGTYEYQAYSATGAAGNPHWTDTYSGACQYDSGWTDVYNGLDEYAEFDVYGDFIDYQWADSYPGGSYYYDEYQNGSYVGSFLTDEQYEDNAEYSFVLRDQLVDKLDQKILAQYNGQQVAQETAEYVQEITGEKIETETLYYDFAPWSIYGGYNGLGLSVADRAADTSITLADNVGNNNYYYGPLTFEGLSDKLTVPLSYGDNGDPGPDVKGTLTVEDTDPNADDAYLYYCDPDYVYSAGNASGTASYTFYNPNTDMYVDTGGYTEQYLVESTPAQSSTFRIWRTDAYNARTVYYTIAGTAVNGTDYSAPFSGSVSFTAGGPDYIDIPVTTHNPGLSQPVYVTLTLASAPVYATDPYEVDPEYYSATIWFEPDPQISIALAGGQASTSVVENQTPQTIPITISAANLAAETTVNYTVSGTAVNGGAYSAPWNGSIGTVTFNANGSLVIPVLTGANVAVPETLTVSLAANTDGYQIGTPSSVTINFQPNSSYPTVTDTGTPNSGAAQAFEPMTPAFDSVNVANQRNGTTGGTWTNASSGLPVPLVNVQAVAPFATGLGTTPGVFAITCSGWTNAFTVSYTVSGTAVAGTSYTVLPGSVTFAANQTGTNLSIYELTNPPLTVAQSVVLTLNPGNSYALGYNPQAVVTLLPNSSLTNSVAAPSGRYWRGSGSDPTYWSEVIPLDYEGGTVYSNLNGNASNLYPGLSSGAWSSQTLYHYNATNVLVQTNPVNRISFNNPLVAFGERTGGTPLYYSQPYGFGVYAGDALLATNPIVIQVYNRSNNQLAGSITVTPPNYFNANSMVGYATNGFQVTTNAFGLSTTLSDSPSLNWGAASLGAYVLTHTASTLASNYYYLVEVSGYPAAGSNAMVITAGGAVAPSLLYTLEFEARPPWRSIFLDQPQFAGSPLPPYYAGKTLAEMLTNSPPVTNAVNFSPSAALNVDDSPELQRHPTLDSFVASLGNDPIALANYVINQIDLTDPMDYSDSGNIAEQAINPGGVSRGALGTFMEKQGSAVDQCALLVYLLRQAGVPAVYEFAPRNGLQMLDARLSQMLKLQLQGAVNEAGQLYTTNTMIAVNYPWVAAYIGTNWVHIFPWLKDYEITEGFNLYDYMPTNYSSAYPWVRDYIYGSPSLTALATNGDNTPSVIFPAYLNQTLQQHHPGVSVADIGVQILHRQHYYARWQDFPTPTWVTNVSTSLESLTDPNLASVSPTLTNIFDTVSVQIYSLSNPTNNLQTGPLRLVDLHNREFYIYQTTNAANPGTVQLSLILLPFRTSVTTQFAFTNDPVLLSREVLTMKLGAPETQLGVRFQYARHRALGAAYPIDPSQAFLGYEGSENISLERPLLKGDQAAICLDYGRVTEEMLNAHATDLWQMQNAVQLNPSLTNSLSPDVYEGAVMYLAGMSYYKNISDFNQVNENLHKVNVLSCWAAGLSKLGAARDGFGDLTNGLVIPVLPSVDMFYYEAALAGNGTVQPDSNEPLQLAQQNYNLLAIINNSAEEHQIINNFYQQTNAVSTVRLLQLSQSQGTGIVPLNYNNFASQGQAAYQGKALQSWDAGIWSQTASALQNSPYTIAYMTPGPITNSAYAGMAALVLGWNQWQALISPQNLNGGTGTPLPNNAVSAGNAPNYAVTPGAPLKFTFTTPMPDTTITPTSGSPLNFANNYNQILNNDVVNSSLDTSYYNQVTTTFNIPTATTPQNEAAAYQAAQSNGFLGEIWGGMSQAGTSMADPVDTITGEHYISETDLQLPGPLPLTLSRNYSSQNLADNQFGAGWKFSIMPYLSVTAGLTNIFAADMDGAVLAYVCTNGSKIWVPTLAANPQLNNNTTAGAGGLVNRLRDRIIQTVTGSTTNYTLYGADGSTRLFTVMSFNNGILNQTRPYLQTWTDSRGNYYTFTYGANSSQPNFGQVIRIQCSNGNYLGFDYDVNAHIIDAYSGDGRRLTYDYDAYGDLLTVTLPDNTMRSYVYQHATQAVTNGVATYSTHLIIEEDKPEGRVLQNVYDSQRRVTNQWSTAGTSLTPIRTATFIFANNFAFANSYTNSISGYTLIIDGNGNTNRYDYTNSLITKITDPLGQTIQQTWYPDNATAPGYPRSLAQMVDKRGMTNQFRYDANGNVTNTIIFGDLTGNGIATQTATNTAVYNTNCLPVQMTDPAGNGTVIVYDPVFNFLPQQVIRYAGSTPVSTNYTIYGNATNVVIDGSITQTNLAFGLPVRQIRAYGAPEAATNDLAYNGNGFLAQSIRYTGTTDPNVTNTFYYNERGQMVNRVDALGAVTFFDYDALNRPIEQENFDESGNALAWSFNYYNDNGELNWVDGPRYNPEDYMFYDYDGAGRVTTEIHWRSEANSAGTGVEAPAGYNQYAQTFFEYDPLGNLLLKVDPRGAMTTNTWDALCRVAQRTYLDTNGVTVLSTEGFGYEPGGQVRYYTNALGGLTTNLYTIAGKPECQRNPDGSTNAWRYYLDGRIHQEIQVNGAYWQTTYDDVNRITTRTFYSAAGVPEATNSVQVDRRGNAIAQVDAGGNVFATTYDGLDRVKTKTGPLSQGNTLQQIASIFYDAAGRVTTNVNALGEAAVSKMDAIGRPISTQIYGASGTLVRETYMAYSPDHNSVMVTNGSGAAAITSTSWTDTDGHTVLSVSYPSSGVNEFTLNRYDLAGNLISAQHDSSAGGVVSIWTTNSFAYDGLNRVISTTDRDNALTMYGYDRLNDLTNRTMPGSLQWQATYNNAGQMLQERNVSGNSATRTNRYAYFASGGPFAGMLQTKTDGRGVTCTNVYDDRLRVTTNIYAGSLPEQNLTTIWRYEPRGFATNITEQFASTNTGLATSLLRAYDAYGQLASESVSVGGSAFSSISQNWDAAGRRSVLNFGSWSYGFGWRADGMLVAASDTAGGGAYSYDTAGLLTNRMVGNRMTGIASRDGEGRPLSIGTTLTSLSHLGKTPIVTFSPQLTETLAWSADGLLASHTLARADFTDSRAYAYANLSRRLAQEQLNLNAGTTWTNTLVYDSGLAAGPGALTQMGQANSSSNEWSGATDAFSRVSAETNNTIPYPANGHANGPATYAAWLDNHPVPIFVDGTNAMLWRAMMEVTPGTHQLTVSALNPNGLYTAWATNSFSNSIAYLTTADSYDNAGNITNRVWKNPSGAVERTQTLSWDARGRLHQVIERGTNNSGYNWTATYDGLSRRLSTSSVLVTNSLAFTNLPAIINSYYDPQVEFLELGVAYGAGAEWKLYGPELNGQYGGMNGTGGFDAVSPGASVFNPTISDLRGNILAVVTNGVVSWNPARPTGFGAVPGYRPVPLGYGASISLSSVWRGRWVDITGYYNVGLRPYDPVSGRWLTYDSVWNESDPNYYTFCGGDPINGFDSDGRCIEGAVAGWNNAPVPANASPAFMNGYMAGGVTSAFGEGASDGASIIAHTDYGNSLQGGVYDWSRGFADVGIGAAALATGGAAYGAAMSSPTLYVAAVNASVNPWTYVLAGGAANGVYTYSQGGSAGDVAVSFGIGGALTYASSPFPLSGGSYSPPSVNVTTPNAEAEEPVIPPGMMALPVQQQQAPAGPPPAAEGPVTVGDILAGHSSDTMIHLTTATEDELATATFPNFTPPHTTPGVFQGSSWVQLGDVSHMTLPEYQELVVGPSAAGYGSDVSAFVTHPPSSVFTPVNVPNLGGVQEFINGAVVKPGTYVPLPGKP